MYVEASLDMSEKYYIFEADFVNWEFRGIVRTVCRDCVCVCVCGYDDCLILYVSIHYICMYI